jgi:DNA-directed RNA polymerase sigma subunit (sigma70/sigma32)
MAPLRGAIGELLPRWSVPTPERLRELIADCSQSQPEGLDAWIEEGDEQRALLPRLMALLTPQERQLLGYRYLQETPLSHQQIQQRMGLSRKEQLTMEQAAIERMRAGARELKG